MKAGHKGKAGQRGRKGTRKAKRPPLVAHRGFAPFLGLWGAGLGATLVMVLPTGMIETSFRGTLIGTFTGLVQPMVAAIAAVVLAAALFVPAAAAHRAARRRDGGHSVVGTVVRNVMPINPARDLGSRRLDDPIETMPFASPAWRDADLDARQPAAVDEPAPPPASANQRDTDTASVPVELDLAACAELPGRNAVWVDEAPSQPEPKPALEPAPEPSPVAMPAAALRTVPATPAPPAPGTAALARLREVPTEALSLPQMVERFAGALHEHRTAPSARALSAADLAAREAALAEALKALAALSGQGAGHKSAAPDHRAEPLRDALSRFQPMREAG